MMDALTDGLAKAPEWVGTLRVGLEHVGFAVSEERRYDQPFGLYAVLLVRADIAVQIASDRAFGPSPLWRIDLMRSEDAGRIPSPATSPAALRAALEHRQQSAVGEDTAETAAWVFAHLDEIGHALSSAPDHGAG
jgi:hypothetical protein